MKGKVLFAVFVMFAAFAAAGVQIVVNGQSRDKCSTLRQGSSSTLLIIGLTADQRILCFTEASPGRTVVIGTVSGLAGDSSIIGIDYRVQDGKLYGVGNAGGVYTIDTVTAAATLVNNLSIALEGTSFGVDFNPAADRLRVISNTGQNLRHNVNTGGVTLNDGLLTYTAPPAAAVAATGVTGAAYTNNDLDASTATTLFDIDASLDQVSIQSPANNGILVATGKLGVDTSLSIGFDIYSTVRPGGTVNNEGFAALPTGSGASFYKINLLTGKATSVGTFPSGDQVVDIAIPLGQR